MSITVTVADEEGRTATIQVAAEGSVETLKALIEAELRVPIAQQALLKDGQPLRPGTTLTASGVSDNDFLFLVRGNPSNGGGSGGASSGGNGPGGLHSIDDLPPNLDPAALIQTLHANPRLLKEFEHRNSELAAAVHIKDVVKVRSVVMKQRLQSMAAKVEEQQALAALEANPMDPEAQRKIEEMIQRENVHRNMEMAMNEMPEAFGSVVMLYIDAEVNGQHIKAFVDSGAQSTIMSAACAERCGVMRLIDRRFAGIAKGVGTSKILGRIHMYQLKIGDSFFPCTFTVLENDDVDFLFGLDMLKRHQCVIDLRRGVLQLGSAGKEVPFLAEKDLPARARGHVGDDGDLDVKMPQALPMPPAVVAAPNHSTSSSASAANSGGGGPSVPFVAPLVSAAGVEQLMALGFTQAQATSALSRTDGKVDEAAGLLFAENES